MSTNRTDTVSWPPVITPSWATEAERERRLKASLAYADELLAAKLAAARAPEEAPMRELYAVYIIHPETDFIKELHVIANDKQTAITKAVLSDGILPEMLDDYDVIAVEIGKVRKRKAKKPPKDDEE